MNKFLRKAAFKKTAAFAVIAAGTAAFSTVKADGISINEVMQSNVHGIMDDFNDFPDSWVEIYNASDSPCDLSAYAISLEDDFSDAFKLPQVMLQPGEFYLLYCDKADISGDEKNHAPFRIDSGKGSVYLWENGEIVQTLSLKKMPAPDVAYGRKNEAEDEWGYQAQPTPGEANCGALVKDVLPEPLFSHEGGVCDASLTLELSKPEDAPADAQLHFTLDGSLPTTESSVYSAPIEIDGTTIVRAALFAEGYMTPLATTHSFIFHNREQTLPIVALSGNPEYFFDDMIGILVEGSYSPDMKNYEYEWRRPVNIEYMDVDGSIPVNQVIETRIKGNTTRSYPLKSMVLSANKRFVTKRLEHEFFPAQRPGQTDFKSLELRNAGQDFEEAHMRDAVFQKLMSAGTTVDFQSYQPVILYLNGEYMGILNLRERSNEDNIYTNYDGLEDIEMIENWGMEVKAGTGDLFQSFKEFYNQEGHTLEEYSALMDVEEFTDVMVGNIICNNWDFPANNNIMWRPQEDGGRWRWVLKDADFSLGLWNFQYDFQYFRFLAERDFRPNETVIGNALYGTQLYKSLVAIPEYRDYLIDKTAIAAGSYLNEQRVQDTIDECADMLAPEMEFHRGLYPVQFDFDTAVSRMKKWYTNRMGFIYDHISDFWGLESPQDLKINAEDKVIDSLQVNGIGVPGNEFDGKWFPGRRLSVAASLSDDDVKVVGWRVTATDDEGEVTTDEPGETFEKAFPNVKKLELKPILESAGIESVTGETDDKVEYYDLQGRLLGSARPAPGIYIRKTGNTVTKVLVK